MKRFTQIVLFLVLSASTEAGNIPALIASYRIAINENRADLLNTCEASAKATLGELIDRPTLLDETRKHQLNDLLAIKMEAAKLRLSGVNINFGFVGQYWNELTPNSRLSILRFWRNEPELISWRALTGLSKWLEHSWTPLEKFEISAIYSKLPHHKKQKLRDLFPELKLSAGTDKQDILSLLKDLAKNPSSLDAETARAINKLSLIAEDGTEITLSNELVSAIRKLNERFLPNVGEFGPHEPPDTSYVSLFNDFKPDELRVLTQFIVSMKKTPEDFFSKELFNLITFSPRHQILRDYLRSIESQLGNNRSQWEPWLEDLKETTEHYERYEIENYWSKSNSIAGKKRLAWILLGSQKASPTRNALTAILQNQQSIAKTDPDFVVSVMKWIEFPESLKNNPSEIPGLVIEYLNWRFQDAMDKQWFGKFVEAFGVFATHSPFIASRFIRNDNHLSTLIQYFQNNPDSILPWLEKDVFIAIGPKVTSRIFQQCILPNLDYYLLNKGVTGNVQKALKTFQEFDEKIFTNNYLSLPFIDAAKWLKKFRDLVTSSTILRNFIFFQQAKDKRDWLTPEVHPELRHQLILGVIEELGNALIIEHKFNVDTRESLTALLKYLRFATRKNVADDYMEVLRNSLEIVKKDPAVPRSELGEVTKLIQEIFPNSLTDCLPRLLGP